MREAVVNTLLRPTGRFEGPGSPSEKRQVGLVGFCLDIYCGSAPDSDRDEIALFCVIFATWCG